MADAGRREIATYVAGWSVDGIPEFLKRAAWRDDRATLIICCGDERSELGHGRDHRSHYRVRNPEKLCPTVDAGAAIGQLTPANNIILENEIENSNKVERRNAAESIAE
jgi:hypothetical protein